MDLLRRDPRARPTAKEILRRLGSHTPAGVLNRFRAPKFVGRAAETRALGDALAESARGGPVLLFVRGPSGVGKTALVRNWLHETGASTDAFIVEGRCYERESLPQKALDGLVDGLSKRLMAMPDAEVASLLPKDVWALARMFPALMLLDAVTSMPPHAPEAVDRQVLRSRAADALVDLLRALSRDRRLVLFVDDFQWADRDSVMLLSRVLHEPRPPPFLLLACYREEDAAVVDGLRRFFRKAGATSRLDERMLSLEPLPPREARELATARLGTDAEARAVAIAAESGGNPFLIEQLAGHHAWALPAFESGRPVLDQIVAARLARLSLNSRRLLEVIAIAGGPLLEEAALGATDPPLEELAPLRGLLASKLVRTAVIDDDSAVDVYHDRIRAAVLAQLAVPARAAIHLRVARSLENSVAPDPEALTLHYRAAGENAEAARYARIAAARASQVLAFDRAATFHRLAIDLNAGRGVAESALYLDLASALVNAGRGAEAAQAYLMASRAPGCPKPGSIGANDIGRRAAEQFLVSGHIDEGLAELRTVLEATGERLARSPRHALVSVVLRLGVLRIRGEEFRERTEEEVDPSHLARIDACWSAALGLGMTDYIQGAMFQMRHLWLALRAGEPYRVTRALAFQVAFESSVGKRTEARAAALSRRTIAIAERIGHPHATALATLTSGVARFMVGDWKIARERIERSERLFRDTCTGVTWELDTARIYSLWSLFYLGEIRELSERVPELKREAVERGDLYGAASLNGGIPVVATLARGVESSEDVRARAHEVLARWSRAGFHVQHQWRVIADVLCHLHACKGREAWDAVEAAWGGLSRSSLLRSQYVRAEAHYLRGIAALGAARDASDRNRPLAVARKAATKLERERASWAASLGHLVHASEARLRGDDHVAERLFASAAAGFDAASMALFATVARRRRGAIVGGAEGATLVKEADEWMAREGIESPARFAGMLAPSRDD
jgi:hypothetical protein